MTLPVKPGIFWLMPTPAKLDPTIHLWLHTPGLICIFEAIEKAGGEIRFVGGCVRDALLGRAVGDIDLACTLEPQKTDAAIKAAGLKTSPTGIAHGTITAIADHKGYEITTLRHDVETDGRHAKVEFTDDWQADAARRDFTMNALYADAEGNIFDYFNGRDDLAKHHVRFIGKAEDRIREDVLRILRFFRFYAWFGKGNADAEGLKACASLAHLMPQLSIERVWREISKLLAAENPAPTWRLMLDNKILAALLPEASNIRRLENLVAAEKKYDLQTSSLARLAALLPENAESALKTAQKLKTSTREAEKLQLLSALPSQLRGKLDPIPFRHVMYQHGADASREAALLYAASDAAASLESALAAANEWQKPNFPIQGEDLLKFGLKPGPRVGEILRAVEDWWIARDFRPTREECLAEAKRLTIN